MMVTATEVPGGLSVDDDVLDGVPLERLESEIMGHSGRLAAATARWLVWIGAYDRREGWWQWQAKSCAHWLNWRCGVSLRTAHEHVRVARRLEELPLLRQTFLDGRISYSKVRAISRVADEFNEEDLVDLALEMTASQIESVCAVLRRADGNEDEEAANAVAIQSVDYTNNHDGTATLTITVPVDDAKHALAAVKAAADETVTAARHGRSNRETVKAMGGINRVRAEAAVGLLTGTVDQVEAPADEVMVVVDNDTLQGSNDRGTSEIDGERISPLVASRLSCDARLQLAIEDAVGKALGVGRTERIVPRWLRRQLMRRDGRMCRFPGCGTTRRLHAHHIIHWEDGGETELENLILLCHHHHKSVHEGGWNVVVIEGRRVFYDPSGQPAVVPQLEDPQPGVMLPEPEKRSAEHLAGSGERIDLPFIVDIIAGNADVRRRRSQRD